MLLQAAPPPGYYLVWSDEFNESSLNTTNWDYWLLGHWNDAVNTTNAVSLNGSNMVITTYTSGGTNFTAMLATDKSFCPRYGYWEANIQWGDTNGMWSAIWLRSPTMGTYLNDVYESGGEMDIAEHRYVGIQETNYIANIVSDNIHWNGYGAGEASSGSPNVGGTLDVGFHTYGLLWTSNSYIFNIDGSESWDGSSTTPPFGSGAFMILSSEVDDTATTWAGYIPAGGYPSQATSGVKMTVDYVRYYAPTNVIFWTGASSAYWNNPANWISNMPPVSTSVLTFSGLSSSATNMTPGQDYAVSGLVFLNSAGAFSINGNNTLTIGSSGIDMVPANKNVTLNSPIALGANQAWCVGPNNSGNILMANANISGSATLTKSGSGTLILNGTNSLSGAFNVDTGSITNDDGAVLVANPYALSSVASISFRSTGTSHSTLLLANNATISAPVNLAGRNTNVVAIESLGGSNQLTGGLTLSGGGSNYLLQADSGMLTVGGVISAGGTATGSRQLTFQGNGTFVVSGSIQNGSASSLTVVETNNGALIINGSIAGPLTVNSGTLAGAGTVAGVTTIQSGGELSPGAAIVNSIGTMSFGSILILSQGSQTYLELNAALNTNDQVIVSSTLDCGGTLYVTNLGGTFSLGQSFQLFRANRVIGNFSGLVLPTLDPSLAWATNQISSGILTVIANTNPPQFTAALPPQVTVGSGKTYTYTASALSPQPYSYQWYNGATPVTGATNSTYLPTAGPAGNTIYSVVVANDFGAATSTVSIFTSVAAPSSSYAAMVLSLNPAGYWPLQETNPPAAATMETNYGTLGRLGNAYYSSTNASVVNLDQAGALAGDTDAAAAFGGGQISYAIVPRLSPALTMEAPFSVEAWVNPSSTTYGVIAGEGGGTGLDGAKAFGGFQMGFGSSEAQMQYYTGGNNSFTQLNSPANYPSGSWYHVVITYSGSGSTTYVNGVAVETGTAATYVPDVCSPFCIGNGKWDYSAGNGGTRQIHAAIDEVAVYTNVLSASRVSTHYNAGINPAAYGAYMTNVLADQPLLYYRMDCAGYTNTPENECPLAMNFGTAPENGAYPSGIPPGGLTGPTNSVLGTNSVAAPVNGLISCVDAGNDPAFNPTGTSPFTVMTWMRTYPADGRLQTIMSHGGTNWTLNLDGTSGRILWNLSNGSQVTSASVLNDGNWHFVAGVYDGVNSYLYVDGALSSSTSATGALSGEANVDLYLGGNADYTQLGNNQRYFAGAVAQAAFFTNALNAAQIQTLYTGVIPTINLGLSGNNVTITYTGRLLSSASLAGPYSAVPGAPFVLSVTNYMITPTGGQMFYKAGAQ